MRTNMCNAHRSAGRSMWRIYIYIYFVISFYAMDLARSFLILFLFDGRSWPRHGIAIRLCYYGEPSGGCSWAQRSIGHVIYVRIIPFAMDICNAKTRNACQTDCDGILSSRMKTRTSVKTLKNRRYIPAVYSRAAR